MTCYTVNNPWVIRHLIEVLQDTVDGFEGQADPSRLLVAPAQAHIPKGREGR